MIYDSAIIGTGPAGVSAALNLKIHNKPFVWFGPKTLSAKVAKAERISNYPGFIDAGGEELAGAFRRHIDAMGIGITDAVINSVMDMGDHYALLAGPEFYEARTLILATGVTAVGALPGEAERVGMGVSYCATCDGGLYRGRAVAVICGNPRFEHEVKYLSELAKQVYFFPLYKDAGDIAENVSRPAARAVGIEGEGRVSALKLSNGERLEVDGVFCLRDAVSLGTLLPGLKIESGSIVVDRAMATNLRGCYAAGDCTGRPYQYAKAVGEGNVAAHSVIEYLAEMEKA